MNGTLFRDRREAGRALAMELDEFADERDLLVLALPRGGVPVGFEVARALGAPLDMLVVRKIGVPGHEELAMGAVAAGAVVWNREVLDALRLDEGALAAAVERETRELARRERAFRDDLPPPEVRGRTVILADDGLATGSTMRAAVQALRTRGPKAIVVAVPVGAAETCRALAEEADRVFCAATPEPFFGVGQFYEDFAQTSDDEVRALLAAARAWREAEPVPPPEPGG